MVQCSPPNSNPQNKSFNKLINAHAQKGYVLRVHACVSVCLLYTTPALVSTL